MTKSFAFIFMLIIAMVVSCNDPLSNSSRQYRSAQDAIIPLSVGNYWKYSINTIKYDFYNNIESEENSSELFVVMDKSYFSGKECYEVKVFDYNSNDKLLRTDKTYFMNQGGHLVSFDNIMPYMKLAGYPAEIGDTISVCCDATMILIAKDLIIKNSLGSFKCYHYQAKSYDDFNKTQLKSIIDV